MRAMAKQGDLTQQVALDERPEDSLFALDLPAHFDRALVQQVGFPLGPITLPEDDLATLERPGRHVPGRARPTSPIFFHHLTASTGRPRRRRE